MEILIICLIRQMDDMTSSSCWVSCATEAVTSCPPSSQSLWHKRSYSVLPQRVWLYCDVVKSSYDHVPQGFWQLNQIYAKLQFYSDEPPPAVLRCAGLLSFWAKSFLQTMCCWLCAWSWSVCEFFACPSIFLRFSIALKSREFPAHDAGRASWAGNGDTKLHPVRECACC